MIITELRVKNFRSFGDTETIIRLDQLTAIIGPNSSGKTAMIHALLKLFGMESKDRAIFRSEEDFEAVKKHLTMNHRQTGICKPPSDSNA